MATNPSPRSPSEAGPPAAGSMTGVAPPIGAAPPGHGHLPLNDATGLPGASPDDGRSPHGPQRRTISTASRHRRHQRRSLHPRRPVRRRRDPRVAGVRRSRERPREAGRRLLDRPDRSRRPSTSPWSLDCSACTRWSPRTSSRATSAPRSRSPTQLVHIVMFALRYEGRARARPRSTSSWASNFLLTVHEHDWDPRAATHLRGGLAPIMKRGPDHLLWALRRRPRRRLLPVHRPDGRRDRRHRGPRSSRDADTARPVASVPAQEGPADRPARDRARSARSSTS